MTLKQLFRHFRQQPDSKADKNHYPLMTDNVRVSLNGNGGLSNKITWNVIALGLVALYANSSLAQTNYVQLNPSGSQTITQPVGTSLTVSGNVGIGTTNPQSALDVSGNINYATMTAGLGSYSNGTPSGYYFVGSLLNRGSGVVQHLEIEVLGGSWADQGLTRWVCNGYGGLIRCTRLNDSYNPDINDLTAFLDVSGNFNFYVSANTDNGWNSFAVSSKIWDGANYRTVNPFYTASPSGVQQQIMVILGPTLTKSGNVGIGLNNPGADLPTQNGPVFETVGNIAMKQGPAPGQGTGSGIIFSDGTIQTTAYAGTSCALTELVMPDKTIVAQGGDYAESVDVNGDRASYEPGDVMVIDPSNPEHFLKSSKPYSTLVAGIYSTKPGYVGRRQSGDPKMAKTEIPMAMIGIVPTKVTTENGPINVGDLLVTSSVIGYAMKGTDRSVMSGAIVGKALGRLDSGTGIVEVLVSLQ